MSKKLIVLVLIAIIAAASLTSTFQGGAARNPLNQTSRDLLQGLDKSGGLRIELLHETTGKSYRQLINTPDGLIVKTVWDKTNGGAVDQVLVVAGKVTRFTRSTAEGAVRYEAVYEDGARIAKAERRRADGTVEEAYARTADGGIWTTFAADGKTVVKEIAQSANGYTLTDYSGGSAVVKALERQEFTMGSIKPEGSTTEQPVLRFWTLNGRVNEWWWSRSDGQIKQHGLVLPSGELRVEYMRGTSVQFVQIWRPVFEDWGRSYYRLKQVIAYAAYQDGKLDKIINLYEDGVTVSSWEDFAYTGGRNWTRHYDRQGLPVRLDSFSYEGGDLTKETVTSKDLSGEENRTAQPLPAQYARPGNDDTGGARLRFDASPFDLKLVPDVKGIVEQFFVEPGKTIDPPPPVYYGYDY